MFLEHLSTDQRPDRRRDRAFAGRPRRHAGRIGQRQPELDLEVIAAELISQVRAISQQQQELSVGEVQQFTVVAERMTFLVSAVASGYYLLLALAPAGSVGRARFELRRASLVLEEELS